MSLFARSNDALNANPTQAGIPIHITTHGSDWLWAAFAIMLLSDLIVFGWQFSFPRGQRVFHQIGLVILTTASIAYFSMASNLGYTGIATEFSHIGFAAGVERQIWYVRYIDWVITTPALLLELVLASGLPLSDIITLMFFDVVMIIVGLVGALVISSYKWGFWVFGMFALFYIWYVLLGPARTSASVIGADFGRSFTTSTAILAFLWLLYPLAWGLADGGNKITPDSEMIFYGVLDVLAKPVFLFIHLASLSRLDLSLLQLSSSKFSVGTGAVNAYDREKHPQLAGAGVGAGAGTTAAAATPASPTTKSGKFFSRKGRHDETTAAAHGVAPTTTTTGATTTEAPPRLSEATVA